MVRAVLRWLLPAESWLRVTVSAAAGSADRLARVCLPHLRPVAHRAAQQHRRVLTHLSILGHPTALHRWLLARSAHGAPRAPTTYDWRCGALARSPCPSRSGRRRTLLDRTAGPVRQARADAAGRQGPRHVADPEKRIKIDKRQWDTALRPILARLRADLGLPEGCELTAGFHSMLVYAPGQFFAPHRTPRRPTA